MSPMPPASTSTARWNALLLARALAEAATTMLAAIATLLCTLFIAPGRGPAVLAVVLSLSLSRSQLDRNARGRLEAAIVLPLVGIAALAVGMLLLAAPWVGAAAFVAGMSVPIWMRRFGPLARRAGGLIALPFVTLLTVPHVHVSDNGAIPAWLIPIVVALLALFWVTVCHLLTRRLRWKAPMDAAEPAAVAYVSPSQAKWPASTRMAIQMSVALAASFVVGYVFFAEHWAWIVLTAFIVNSGNRGRLDVVYKSSSRVVGAATGTLFALVFILHAGIDGATTAMMILAALFLGVWLRPFNYAWWALFVTVALAILQGFDGGSPLAMLWQRLEEIAIGAAIGMASAWFVLPLRSTDVLRRRMADALAALAEAIDPAISARSAARFDAALSQLELVAPAFRATRLLTQRMRTTQPADWADTLLACRAAAKALIAQGSTPGQVRTAVGAARKALREPDALLQALTHLRDTLHAMPSPPSRQTPQPGDFPA